ncbi:hypothetical protein QJR60_03715 [Paraclostridium sordellii]|uniref:hypothetical protein n=1 Tax=Paraclostridium sordellii TaxID=1505 RepID=UPI0030D489C0
MLRKSNLGIKISKIVINTIIPASGLEIRFLPVIKSQEKEMIPIVDEATLQYMIE